MMVLGRSIGNFEIGTAKTGQTTAYGSGATGDDGYYEKGIDHRFEVLTTGQYSGTTNITINAKTDVHSNEVVIDHARKLMWSRTYANSVGPSSNGTVPWTTNANGEGIFTYCAAANAANLSGHNDWRVANKNELADLCNLEAPSNLPDATAFPSWSITYNLWTSSTVANTTANSFYLSLTGGGIVSYLKTNATGVVLVRSI